VKRIAFLVNGREESAIAHRARAFADRLRLRYEIDICYRNRGRIAAIGSFRRLLDSRRPDLTYVLDLGYSGVLAAAWYRRRAGNRLVVDTGDAIHALARSIGRNSLSVALTGWLERFALSSADHVVVRGTRHREWMSERGIEATLVNDGVETDMFAPRDVSGLRKRLGVEHVITVGLVGSSVWSKTQGIGYGWDLIDLISLLRDAPVKGIMIGDGSGIAHLRQRLEQLGLADRVLFLGYQPYESLPDYLSVIDVCLSTQTNDLVGSVRTTGKLPLYLASGRYILASRVGEAELLLPDEMLVEYHGTVDLEYPARLAERMRALMANPARLLAGRNGIEVARSRLDYEVLARRVEEVIRNVLGMARPVAVSRT
jgi:glycosyltransferase involved in cell wall biosynthesis